tara:strand:- start:191 stop:442 length:252 start_codon:yes stop_codon:yes gene_type:complete
MKKEVIVETINGFLIEEFEVEPSKILPEANLRETLDLDSLDYIDLVVVIEEAFSFKVVPDDFIDIATFEDFYNFAQRKLQENE